MYVACRDNSLVGNVKARMPKMRLSFANVVLRGTGRL